MSSINKRSTKVVATFKNGRKENEKKTNSCSERELDVQS